VLPDGVFNAIGAQAEEELFFEDTGKGCGEVDKEDICGLS
jgi:hypothetical protein